MSASTKNWELGVVSFYDSFNDFDRFTALGSAFTHASGTSSDTLVLDSDICADYAGSAFYAVGRIYQDGNAGSASIPGNEIIIGPSTNSSYSGAIEKGTIDGISATSITTYGYSSNMFLHKLTADYASGDQVIFRTVPLGWTPASSTMSKFGCMPIKRYDDRQNLTYSAYTSPGLDDYGREDQYAVRLFTNYSTAQSTNYIYRYSPINSFSPRIRTYRMSFYHRIGRYDTQLGGTSSLQGSVQLGIVKPDGSAITSADGNNGNFYAGALESSGKLFSGVTATSDWTYAEGYISAFPDSDNNDSTFKDTGSNYWSYVNIDNDLSNSPGNKGNRWKVKIALFNGINTAFDVDDLVVEHAHGTSQEANGFYAISDYPDPSTIVAQSISTWKRNRLANGTLKQISTESQERPKFILSAEFQDVPASTYEDLRVLETWNKRGELIALRPKIDGLPEVMVGTIRLKRQPPATWSLSYCTFTLEFEEA